MLSLQLKSTSHEQLNSEKQPIFNRTSYGKYASISMLKLKISNKHEIQKTNSTGRKLEQMHLDQLEAITSKHLILSKIYTTYYEIQTIN